MNAGCWFNAYRHLLDIFNKLFLLISDIYWEFDFLPVMPHFMTAYLKLQF